MMKYALSALVCLMLLFSAGCADPGKRTFWSDVGDAISEDFESFTFDDDEAIALFNLDKGGVQYFLGVDGGEDAD